MSNPHNLIPKPSSSPSQDDSPTPNIAEYIKSIPSWSPEEQIILEDNMKRYPASQNAEFKRLTLLMTNLPNKRLRDVSLRVKYMKAKEKQDISWESFLHSSFGQQRVEVSPSHSIKSPRATSTDRDDPPKRSRRTPIRMKKDDDDLSMSSNSNQVSSVNSSTINARDGNSMSIPSNAPPPLVSSMAQPITVQHPQIPIAPQPCVTAPQPTIIPQPPNPSYARPNVFPQNSYLQSSLGRTAPVMYQTRDRRYTQEDQVCDRLINENEQYLELITATVMRKQGDFGEYISLFSSNVSKLLQITERMTANLPLFYFSPININPPKFKKIDLSPQEQIRIQPTYGLEFQLGKN
ncbi:hypothetical protein ENUP19_0254G0035 [Entamoeba nuttalli]|uniref:Myb-like domain-containing protein n=1 Tax=Entamoeba nuttalli TaxID=412467 RepID=A0ABQ0DRP7_9EUKA